MCRVKNRRSDLSEPRGSHDDPTGAEHMDVRSNPAGPTTPRRSIPVTVHQTKVWPFWPIFNGQLGARHALVRGSLVILEPGATGSDLNYLLCASDPR
jgi:hypothetical protein